MKAIRVVLFNSSKESFIHAINEQSITFRESQLFSSAPTNSGVVGIIEAFSDAMPWNALAKVIVAWIEAKKHREVIVTTSENEVVHMKGYSAKEVEKILSSATNITVIDTENGT